MASPPSPREHREGLPAPKSHHEVPKIEALIGLSDVVKASDEDIAWLYDGAPIRAPRS